ncbi:MAG: ergothioneine biosynthesis protein EgtB [Cryomorphaceae bacterium]|nr:ergothioneine biosynthesis protein EgtB [Flavobacteriales bacterium]
MSQTKNSVAVSETVSEKFISVRKKSLKICKPLLPEDYVIQPAAFVSPPKWHLAHTSWFFETFVLLPYAEGYRVFNPDYNFIFNSYYEALGDRLLRTDRGNLSRPSIDEVKQYRSHVDNAMQDFLSSDVEPDAKISNIIETGLQHEMQHQELLFSDIKYILGHNPLYPVYDPDAREDRPGLVSAQSDIRMEEGIYEIGYKDEGFFFDNEHGRHKVYLAPYAIATAPVTYGEYIKFIEAGGYDDHTYWHADGWDWLSSSGARAPLYMEKVDGVWMRYTLSGRVEVNLDCPVMHVNFYEASAYAAFAGRRLPTEAEWEAASERFQWGQSWEWTGSAYLPYPGYMQPKGAVGEYNGKFMVNQMVLRGASPATFPGHSRASYRNFFQPLHQWQFTGIRTAISI